MKSAKRERRSNPLISVVIPTYNVERYLERTLYSIFHQSYKNFEVIIQDGGSTDRTVHIIKKYAKKYPYALTWESKKDKGQTDAINKGFNKAKGDIFYYLNGDDLLSVDAFASISESYKEHAGCLWFTGYGNIIDDDDIVISHWVTLYKNFLLRQNRRFLLLCVNYFTQPSTFLTKKAYQLYGPFTGVGKIILEYELWIKLSRIEMPIVIEKNLSSFRLTRDGFSSTSFQKILSADQELIRRETSNYVILLIHWLNNMSRIALISLLRKYD